MSDHGRTRARAGCGYPPAMSDGKYLSWILRHRPDAAGLALEPGGWVEVGALLAGVVAQGRQLDRVGLERIVAGDRKGRFSFDDDGRRIRANQGHSVPVDLELERVAPPPVLYHGTVARFLDSIRERGLVSGRRHHVHLSADVATARAVGARRGRPVVLTIDAATMVADGHRFFRSANGVWLVDHVPSRFLAGPTE